MAQQLLDREKVRSGFQEVGREGMPKRVRGKATGARGRLE